MQEAEPVAGQIWYRAKLIPDALLIEKTDAIKLLPPQYFVFGRYSAADAKVRDFTWIIAAWVRRGVNDKLFSKILGDAAQNGAPQGDPADAVRSQVARIYEALHKGRVAYIRDALVFVRGQNDYVQSVRLPEMTLQDKVANCLDGAVLFATLLRHSHIRPLILLVPGHALVGWKTDNNESEFMFLETNAFNETFSEAHRKGMERWYQVRGKLRTTDSSSFIEDVEDFAVLIDVEEVVTSRRLVTL